MSGNQKNVEQQKVDKTLKNAEAINALNKIFEEKVLNANLSTQEKRDLWKEIVKGKDEYVIGASMSMLSKQYGNAVQFLFEEADYSDIAVTFDPKDECYQDDMTRLYRQTHIIDEKDEINKGDAAIGCFERAIIRYRGQQVGNDIEFFKDWFERNIIYDRYTYSYPIEEVTIADIDFYRVLKNISPSYYGVINRYL